MLFNRKNKLLCKNPLKYALKKEEHVHVTLHKLNDYTKEKTLKIPI